MKDFVDSESKTVIRDIIYSEARQLNTDKRFVYFGLPGKRCLDIKEWQDNIKSAYCCEIDAGKYSDMLMELNYLIPGRFELYEGNVWDAMKELDFEFIDLCNFDFYGGPSSSPLPEIEELHSLNEFFTKQRKSGGSEKPFLLAWTFGVRNTNFDFYKNKAMNYFNQTDYKDTVAKDKVEDWLSEKDKKMIRSYIFSIPNITYDYAKEKRYVTEVIDIRIYKKYMFFCLLKITPREDMITQDEYTKFLTDIFERAYRILDEHDNHHRLEKMPLNQFLRDE